MVFVDCCLRCVLACVSRGGFAMCVWSLTVGVCCLLLLVCCSSSVACCLLCGDC